MCGVVHHPSYPVSARGIPKWAELCHATFNLRQPRTCTGGGLVVVCSFVGGTGLAGQESRRPSRTAVLEASTSAWSLGDFGGNGIIFSPGLPAAPSNTDPAESGCRRASPLRSCFSTISFSLNFRFVRIFLRENPASLRWLVSTSRRVEVRTRWLFSAGSRRHRGTVSYVFSLRVRAAATRPAPPRARHRRSRANACETPQTRFHGCALPCSMPRRTKR